MPRRFYLTTTLPYVNAPPHIGFALEMVQADILARFRRLLGDEVFFNTGTDEHGLKIYRAAQKEGKEPQRYVDEYAAKFDKLKEALNLSYDSFIRTTDLHHVKAAQEFWRRCEKNGDIEKKLYQIKYCVECELEKTESELENDHCMIHPHAEIEIIEEENYFFKFSNYRKPLLRLYENQPNFVIPERRLNEVKEFVEQGLDDFSISRLKNNLPWGVPVPGDDDHVMYVWFDALVSYISALGWPQDQKKFEKFWGTKENPNAIQFAGKDNLRQQSAMWQAMLMAAGLPPSKQIFIHGFIQSEGQKMSKSLGNVIDPFELVERYGTDAVRHFFAQHIHPFEDTDFTIGRFKLRYNSDLADDLGNLALRIMQLAQTYLDQPIRPQKLSEPPEEFKAVFEENPPEGLARYKYRVDQASDMVFKKIKEINRKITQTEPYKVIKDNPEEGKKLIVVLAQDLYDIADWLKPFMPQTAEKIQEAVKLNKKPASLFPRLD